MKKIAFTICSNNYLSQAKVLSDSVYKYDKDNYMFFIVLCDKKSEKIDYSIFHANFIEAEELGIENFEWMTSYYDIVELNTAIKPFAFKYLIKKENPQYIHYLDPDIRTFASLNIIEEELGDNSILLTPHSLSPIPFDGKIPTDNIFLNFGIYNLGFLGIKVDKESERMIDWWSDFLSEHCISDPKTGFFVDQLPMELVPLYFNNVKVSHHRGLNVAYWNLHDRKFSEKNGVYYLNDNYPLVFFHFSNYKISSPNVITTKYNRSKMNDDECITSLYNLYYKEMLATKYSHYKSIKCVYTLRRKKWFRELLRGLSYYLYSFASKLFDYIRRL